MGLEIDKAALKNLNGIWDPNEMGVTNHKKPMRPDDVEIGEEFNGVAPGDVNVDRADLVASVGSDTEAANNKAGVSNKEEILPEEKKAAKMINYELQYAAFDKLRPGEQLKSFLDEKITDEKVKAKVDQYLDEISKLSPEEYLSVYEKSEKKNPLMHALLEVYIRDEVIKAEEELAEFLDKDKSDNITSKLENIKQGMYRDEKGVMHSLELNGQKKDGVHVYPSNPYQEYAFYHYETEVLPYEMDTKMRQALLKLEEEGKLQNLEFDEDLVQAIVKAAQKSPDSGSDVIFERYVRNRSDIRRITQRHDKIMKRREELKHVTQKEIDNKLKKSTKESIKEYMEAHKNEDGTYDLSGISEAIEYRVGKDYLVNRNDDPNKVLYEVEQARKELIAQGIADKYNFDKEDSSRFPQTKDLIDFCDFEYEHRNHTPSIVGAAQGLFNGAVTGAIAHIAAPQVREVIYNKTVHIHQNVVVNVNGVETTIENLVDQIKQKKINISVWRNICQAVEAGAISGILLNILEEAIFGRDIDFERECFDKSDFDRNKERYTIKANYEQYLKDTVPSQYERIKFILDMYPAKADGTWDYDDFFNNMRIMAGLGSNLNCQEIAGSRMYPDLPSVKPAEISLAKAEKHWSLQTEDVVEEMEISEDNLNKDDQIIFNKRARSSGWSHLANNIYNCGPDGKSLVQVFGLKKAIRILKLAQAVTDGNYSLERMNSLYELSIKSSANLKNIEGFDYGTYYSVLMGNFPASIKLPKELAGVVRCEISEDEHELVAPKATNVAGAPRQAKGPAVGKSKTKVLVKGEKIGADMYFFKDETGRIHEYESKSERDADVEAAEQRTGTKAEETTYEKMAGEEE